jgi:hypothetical protein
MKRSGVVGGSFGPFRCLRLAEEGVVVKRKTKRSPEPLVAAAARHGWDVSCCTCSMTSKNESEFLGLILFLGTYMPVFI